MGTPSEARYEAGPSRGDTAEWFHAWLTAPTSFDGIFPPEARRAGVLYCLVSVPVVALAAALFVDDADSYLLAFSLLPLVLFGVPCLVISTFAIRRAPAVTADRPSYLLWLAGTVMFCLAALGLIVGAVTEIHVANRFSWLHTLLIFLLLSGGIVRLTRSRSGQRAFTVDMVEAAMAVVVISAPCALLWADDIVEARDSWFTVPAAMATAGMVFGSYWALALVIRLGPNARTLERCGLALCFLGVADAALQTAQGVAGFDLWAPPLIAVHAACLSICVLVPLHLPRSPRPRLDHPGLDRLPPIAQVRAGYLATGVTLAGLPALVLATVAVDEEVSWAPPFSLGVATLLVVLAGLRQLSGVHETRLLYAQVERAAQQRHLLLAQLMQRADEDRHRVAAELHEQAISAYTSVVMLQGSYSQGGAQRRPKDSAATNDAGDRVRHELAHHADSLRDLMLAIQPLEADRSGTRTLAAPIHAYLDSLYGDLRSPDLKVTTGEDLFLDWTTETILLRVVQEALRNVWRHSRARNVEVEIAAEGGVPSVCVRDDGDGFDPGSVTESGLATMRAFAAVVHGDVRVESAPGAGTTVVARLGAAPPGSPGEGGGRLLRLVPNRKLP
ncbi:MAG TPA: ATP-binding protein [Acidimicrobiales bacterium]